MIGSDQFAVWNGSRGGFTRTGGRHYVECRTCGFEPADQEQLPLGACPKCHSGAWHRVARPGRIDESALTNRSRRRMIPAGR